MARSVAFREKLRFLYCDTNIRRPSRAGQQIARVNLASLGANVSLVSVAGKDEAGKALMERLNSAGVDCSGVVIADDVRTTTKVRILAGQVHSTRQQVIRIDYEGERLTIAVACAHCCKNACAICADAPTQSSFQITTTAWPTRA